MPERLGNHDAPDRIGMVTAVATGIAAGLVAVVLASLGGITGERNYLVRAVLPALLSTLAWWQVYRRRPHILQLWVASAALIAAQVSIVGREAIQTSATLSLQAIGFLGIFVFERPSRWYVAGYTLFFGVTTAAWQLGDSISSQTVLDVAAAMAIFAVLATVMTRTRVSLESEQHRLRVFFDASPIATFELDLAAAAEWARGGNWTGTDPADSDTDHLLELITVKRANPAAVELLEAASAQSITGSVRSLSISNDPAETGRAILAARLSGRDRIRVPISGRTRLGNRLDVLLDVVIPSGLDGLPDMAHVILTMTDVTSLVETEERLETTIRSKDQFVVTISHELRGPLTTAAGLAAELRDRGSQLSERETAETVATLAEGTDQAATIVNDLLMAVRANLDGLESRVEDIPIEEALVGIPTESRIWLEVQTPGIQVRADRIRIRQILQHLLDNARKYGGEHIRVIAGAADGSSWFEVRDDGQPIPESIHDMIFEPYGRATDSTTPGTSIGVGLTLARRLARLMDGDLTYHHDGIESIFRLTLPCTVPALQR